MCSQYRKKTVYPLPCINMLPLEIYKSVLKYPAALLRGTFTFNIQSIDTPITDYFSHFYGSQYVACFGNTCVLYHLKIFWIMTLLVSRISLQRSHIRKNPFTHLLALKNEPVTFTTESSRTVIDIMGAAIFTFLLFPRAYNHGPFAQLKLNCSRLG